ncbi:MAG: hypothetical protein GY749_20965 [Desulfobacteraceae bacterium]|nr:hypothetical protein [Desulfobacteraceae bacterium]
MIYDPVIKEYAIILKSNKAAKPQGVHIRNWESCQNIPSDWVKISGSIIAEEDNPDPFLEVFEKS